MTLGTDKKKAMTIGAVAAVIIILLLLMKRAAPATTADGRPLNIPSIGVPNFPLTIFDVPELKLFEPVGSCGCGCINPEKVEVEKVVYRDKVQPYSRTTPYLPTLLHPEMLSKKSSASFGVTLSGPPPSSWGDISLTGTTAKKWVY
jgi:hypothetical protein